jgi:uncharacterized protein (TIRG00374 family)
MAAVGLVSDLRNVLRQLGQFPVVTMVPAIVALTLTNYVIRFGRWHWLIGRLAPGQVTWDQSLLTFFSGFSMVLTPGKVGELLKSYLLRDFAGVPVTRSAPVVFAERLYDGIAMVLLSLAGLVSFRIGVGPVVAFALAALLSVIVLSRRSVSDLALVVAGNLPLIRARLQAIAGLLSSARELTAHRVLLPSVALGVVSWFGECLAFYLVLVGLGLQPSSWLLLSATFILAMATLLGSLSMLPGGVGAAELTISGMLIVLVSADRDTAGAATILIRLCTIWFGAILGAACLMLATLRLQAAKVAKVP